MTERPAPDLAAAPVAVISVLLSLLVAILFPMMTDEAYYIDWARGINWPSLGFFDHPPFVSWLGLLSRYFDHIFAARLLVWASTLMSAYFIWRLARKISPERSLTAVALMTSSIGGLAGAFLLTPDCGVTMAWIIAIHEAFFAISKNPKRWITAGIATGVGILSKYTMVLIGPVFLLALIKEGRNQLKSPWPYLGGIACLLVILPHLWWQNSNDWVTFKFQLRHGFSLDQAKYSKSILPRAVDADEDSSAYVAKERLIRVMSDVSGFRESIKKRKPKKSDLERAWQYVGDYFGGVAALWGLYSFTGLGFLISRLKRKQKPQIFNLAPEGFSVIQIGTWFPLVFFACLSPFTKIEANWPAMHMTCAAIWIAWYQAPKSRTIYAALCTHLTIFGLLGLILAKPEIFGSTRENRLLLESRGYKALVEWLKNDVRFNRQVIAVDSYQLKSNIRFYGPNVDVVQWPGFTRDSEYTRGRREDLNAERKIIAQDHFSVISTSGDPKSIPGFQVENVRGIRVCPSGTIGVFSETHPELPCEKGLREWWVAEYVAQKP
jgi:hypothetical protein